MNSRSYLYVSFLVILTALCYVPLLSFGAAFAASDRPNLLLSDQDAGLYRSIFKQQHVGEMTKADTLIEQLTDKRLMGYVLSQRYLHPTAYTSKFAELRHWMDYYSDHPNAKNIHALAIRKSPTKSDEKSLKQPKKLHKIRARSEPTMVFGKPMHKAGGANKYDKKLERDVIKLLRRDKNEQAIDKVVAAEKKASTPDYEIDYLKSKVAESYLYEGQVQIAYTLASMAYERSGDKVPLAGWIYGLTTWYNGNYDAAARGFKSAAISEYDSGWMKSAASFWTARAYDRLEQPHNVAIWLSKAQEHPRTFYGLLAAQAAGKGLGFNWSTPPLTREMVRTMAKSRTTMRALALMDVGRYDLAEEEFLHVTENDPLMRQALIAFAQSYDMAELSLRLGAYVKNRGGDVFDAALYPDLDIALFKGQIKSPEMAIDSDLLLAIARQESRFNPEAVSSSGAVGLMQIMPATAQHVANRYDLKYTNKEALFVPHKNFEIGQYYVYDLLKSKITKGDVISVLASYNAGPGNLQKWRAIWPDVTDPLLFTELIPVAETRKYIEHVLANYWIYRSKHKRDIKPLIDMVYGQPLSYAAIAKDIAYDIAHKK